MRDERKLVSYITSKIIISPIKSRIHNDDFELIDNFGIVAALSESLELGFIKKVCEYICNICEPLTLRLDQVPGVAIVVAQSVND